MRSDSQRSFSEARHPQREKGRDRFLRGDFLDELAELVPSPRRILVLGSGDGKESMILSKRFPSASIVSMDLSAPELEDALSIPELRGTLVRGDWDNPPFSGERFDLAIFFAALHHSTQMPRTLGSLHRVLRPGGVVYATHEPMSSFLLGHFQRRRMSAIAEREGGIENSPSRGDYRRAFTDSGFVDISIRPCALNLIRLRDPEGNFEDVSVRRNPWPERWCATCLKWIGNDTKRSLAFIDCVQRLAFGLFGVTIIGRKR